MRDTTKHTNTHKIEILGGYDLKKQTKIKEIMTETFQI